MIRLRHCLATLLLAACCVSEPICGSEGFFAYQAGCTDKCPINTVYSDGTCSPDPSCKKGYLKEGRFYCEQCTDAAATLYSDLGICAAAGSVKCALQIANYSGSVINAREAYLNLTCIEDLQKASIDRMLDLFMPRYSMYIYRKINSKEYYRYESFIGYLRKEDVSQGLFYLALKNDEDNPRDDVYHIEVALFTPEYTVAQKLHALYRAPFINFTIEPREDHLLVKHVDVRSEEGMSIAIRNEQATVFEDSVYTYNDMKLQVKWASDFMCLHMYVRDIDRGACSPVEFKPADPEIRPIDELAQELEPASYEEQRGQDKKARYHSSLLLTISSAVAFLLYCSISVHSAEDIHHETRQASSAGYRSLLVLVYLQCTLAAVYLFDFLRLSVRFVAAYACYKLVITASNYLLHRAARQMDALFRLYLVGSAYLCFQLAAVVVLWTDGIGSDHLWMAAALFGFDLGSYLLARVYTVRMFDEQNTSRLYKYSQWYLFFD